MSGLVDERVAELDDGAFTRAAQAAANALRHGEGLHLAIEPGDMTSYSLIIGPTIVVTVGVHIPDHSMRSGPPRPPSALVQFGTESNNATTYWGHASRLDHDLTHPWTAAVWRRLYALITQEMTR